MLTFPGDKFEQILHCQVIPCSAPANAVICFQLAFLEGQPLAFQYWIKAKRKQSMFHARIRVCSPIHDTYLSTRSHGICHLREGFWNYRPKMSKPGRHWLNKCIITIWNATPHGVKEVWLHGLLWSCFMYNPHFLFLPAIMYIHLIISYFCLLEQGNSSTTRKKKK